MHSWKGMQATFLVALPMILAGCSGSGSGSQGFDVTAPETPTGAYHFSASGSADNYTWDLGDHTGLRYGREVDHTYGFANGEVTVKLTTKSGDETATFTRAIVRGTGTNAPATFLFEVGSDWAVVGEAVTLSASLSHDPDGDALMFSWRCENVGYPTPQKPHSHGNMGPAFKSPPAGSVTAGLTNRTLPAADQTLSGDFCKGMGKGTPFSTAKTLAGAFAEPCKCQLTLVATDGVHPTVSGQYTIIVTNPDVRPNRTQTFHFEGDLTAGVGVPIQGYCNQAPQPTQCDVKDWFYSPNSILGASAVYLNATYTAHPADQSSVPGEANNKLAWTLYQGECGNNAPTLATSEDPAAAVVVKTSMPQTQYCVHYVLKQGVNVHYAMDGTLVLDRDPAKLFY